MKKFLFLILGVFLFGGIYKYNGKTYEYEVIDTVDIICDKEIKKKSFICCNRRFFSFEDMEKFIVTGKMPDYSYLYNVDCKGYKTNVEEFKEALKNGDFKKAEIMLQKEKSLVKYGYDVILETKDYKKIVELLKPYAKVPDKVLIELANKAEFEKLDYFVKDKKVFAKKYFWKLNRRFYKHYGLKFLDIFDKKKLYSLDSFDLKRAIGITDDGFLKGYLCENEIFWQEPLDIEYCKFMPKNSTYYLAIFDIDAAIEKLKKVKIKYSGNSDTFFKNAMLLNLYLVKNDIKNARKTYKKMFEACYKNHTSLGSKFLGFIFSFFFPDSIYKENPVKDCRYIVDRNVKRNYKWLKLFYDYNLSLRKLR